MSQLLANIHIPGAFWLALIGGVVTWLPQVAPDAPWLPTALLVLLALLKALDVVVNPPPPLPLAPRAPRAETAADDGDVVLRWLVG